MRWPRLWKDRSWEDRVWYGLLLWNLLALVYLVFRTPYADAAWVYRITLWADIAAFAWWVGRTVQAIVLKVRARRQDRADVDDPEPAERAAG